MKKDTFWNLPNTLTVLRIALVPVMVVLLWVDPSQEHVQNERGIWGPQAPERWVCILTMAIFVGAMITDIIDGYLARKWNLVSVAGAFLDPLADKLMVVTVLVMCVPNNWLPGWLVALLICRELTITGLRTIAVSEGLVLSASVLGKFKTATQATALGFLLWHHETDLFWLVEVDAHACGVMLMYLATVFSLWSAGSYLNQFFRHASLTAKLD